MGSLMLLGENVKDQSFLKRLDDSRSYRIKKMVENNMNSQKQSWKDGSLRFELGWCSHLGNGRRKMS